MPQAYVISNLSDERITGTFNEKELQRKIKQNLELKL